MQQKKDRERERDDQILRKLLEMKMNTTQMKGEMKKKCGKIVGNGKDDKE